MIKKLLIVLMLISSPAWATDYFCKDDASGSGNGLTDATAFSFAQVRAKTDWVAGDDLYFKCDDNFTGGYLNITWAGTSGNRVIIGSYYGFGTIGVSGSKPVIDGNNVYPELEWGALIYVEGMDYVTIENLEIRESANYGVQFKNSSDYFVLRNCDIHTTYRCCLVVAVCDFGEIYNNDMYEGARKAYVLGYSDRPIPPIVSIKSSDSLHIYQNKIHDSWWEGIDIDSGATNTIFEYNEVYGNYRLQTYICCANNNTIRYNLIYGTNTNTNGQDGRSIAGVWIAREDWCGATNTDDNKIYGNFVANTGANFFIGAANPVNNTLAYNNTFMNGVDYNVRILGGTGHEFINNIVGGSVATSAPAGSTTANYNLWSAAPDVDLRGANDLAYASPLLYKTTGWSAITTLTVADFALQSGSTAINTGLDLGDSYDDGLNVSTTIIPGTISLLDKDNFGTGWDLGGSEYTGGAVVVDPATGYVVPRNLTETIMASAGVTITITLSDATWGATVGDDNALTTALIAGMDSDMSESTGWDAIVKAGLTHANVTRTSDSIVTIVIPAFVLFNISVSETISTVIPASCTSAGAAITCNTFVVSAIQASSTSRGMLGSSTAGDLSRSASGGALYHKE